MAILAEACGDDRLHYELSRELLSITRQQRNAARRARLHDNLEASFKKHFYDSEEDALSRARAIAEERNRRKKRDALLPGQSGEPAANESTFEPI